ncbi:MAG: hypothetical protein A2W31_04605 [Planctomycetes bacterium RBG_16_64_10]|nr:MAG: hypothetical protein A2W31_04605 [Planctomycetes bacterium RBG_16_64_10]
MCQTLFYIPYRIGGVQIFGCGVLLVCWFVGSIVLFVQLVRKHGLGADTRGHVLPVLVIGAAIGLVPRLFPGGLPIRGYGVLLLLGAVVGVALAAHRARQMGLTAELIFALAFWMFLPGILGARMFHVIEYWESGYHKESLAETFKAVINVPEGGLVLYGSLVGAGIGLVAFVRKHRLPGLALADLIAPSLALGLALGRIGCLLNGCCYGGRCDLPWAVSFPPTSPPYYSQVRRGQMMGFDLGTDLGTAPHVVAVAEASLAARQGLCAGDRLVRMDGRPVETTGQAQQYLATVHGAGTPLLLDLAGGRQVQIPVLPVRRRSLPVHPTQIYSSVAAFLLGLVLWFYYPFRRRDGEVVALLLSIYPIQRILIEVIRVDEPAVFGTGLSISQNVSLLLLVGAAFFWRYLAGQPRGSALPVKTDVDWRPGQTGRRRGPPERQPG